MTLSDAGALALLAAGIGGLYAAVWTPAAPAATADIRIGGKLVEQVALDASRDFSIAGHTGDSRLRVEPGRIRFIDGPCRNRVCIHSGWLDQAGSSTACLPNRVSISLKGGDQPGGVDAFGF